MERAFYWGFSHKMRYNEKKGKKESERKGEREKEIIALARYAYSFTC